MTLPVKNQVYDLYIALEAVVDPSTFVTNPTIEAGDFQVSTDGSALANLTTLPVVDPAGSTGVKVQLTAAEMNGAKVQVFAEDQAGAEWSPVHIFIDVPEGSSESVYDILTGDHIEDATSITINKKNTMTPVLQKDISGSLLANTVTIRTTEA